VVIDSGLSTADKDFVADLAEVLNPADVRWIWITHPDRDHTGGLWKLLQAAPKARLVTTFLGLGIMTSEWDFPLDRVFLLNPGQALNVGDRRLHCFRPPLFDKSLDHRLPGRSVRGAVQLGLLRGPDAVA
jgi:flavorubredoxin